MIDGHHSINQVYQEWEYVSRLSDDGVVVLHDTNSHSGPYFAVESIDDTLFDISQTINSEIEVSKSLFNDTTKSVLYLNNEIKTQAYWLDKAGFQMNTAVTLNILGTIFLSASPFLIRSNTIEKTYKLSNGTTSTFPTIEVDNTLAYVSIGAGLVLNIISLTYWYECSDSLKKAGKQNKISYNISHLGANIAYRF
jgi:hypothetical protein